MTGFAFGGVSGTLHAIRLAASASSSASSAAAEAFARATALASGLDGGIELEGLRLGRLRDLFDTLSVSASSRKCASDKTQPSPLASESEVGGHSSSPGPSYCLWPSRWSSASLLESLRWSHRL